MDSLKYKFRLIKGAVWGASMSILVTTILTIAGDLRAPLKTWLASTFSHHWLGKSIISVLVFAAVLIVAMVIPTKEATDQNENDANIARLLYKLISVAIIAILSLLAFYFYEYFQ